MPRFKKTWAVNNFKKNQSQKKILWRSKWEIAYANFIDNLDSIKSWRQDYPFKYHDRYVSKKIAIYYIDFHIITNSGQNILVEIKPISTLNETLRTKSIRYKKIYQHNYLKNVSKFDSVAQYCRRNGWKFYLVEKNANGLFSYYTWDYRQHKAILASK